MKNLKMNTALIVLIYRFSEPLDNGKRLLYYYLHNTNCIETILI